MKIILYLLILTGGVIIAFAQDNKPQRSIAEIVNMPVVYRVAGMEKIEVRTNLKYSSAEDPNLLMDVYLPAQSKNGEKMPVVFFIHGGAGSQFKAKDWGIYKSWGRLTAASGMVAVTFTHRLGYPKTLLQEGASDVQSALNYFRNNAEKFNADKDRVCLAAYSAGGPMLSAAMSEKPAYVKCLVAFYAFMDVQQSDLHRQNETPETIKKLSPIIQLAKDAERLPPIFLARAGQDAIPTMNDSIDRFISEAIRQNAPLTAMNHPTGVHGFDNQNDDERSREIIRAAIDFMKFHLAKK
jgi:acetyl esterase/lipase